MRWLSSCSVTTCAAAANAASAAAASPQCQSMQRLPGTSSVSSGAPAASAASAVVTAGSGVIIHDDELGRIQRLGARLGDDQRDRFADMPHLVRRPAAAAARTANGSPVCTLASTVGRIGCSPSAVHIRRGQHRQHAGHRRARPPASMPRDPACACGERRITACVTRSKRQIVEIGAVPGDETRILPPLRCVADHGRIWHLRLPLPTWVGVPGKRVARQPQAWRQTANCLEGSRLSRKRGI